MSSKLHLRHRKYPIFSLVSHNTLSKPSLPLMADPTCPFDVLSEEILFAILDALSDCPLDRKSFSLVSKSFLAVESRHRRTLRPLRPDLLPPVLAHRYPSIQHLDLSLCPVVTDNTLSAIAAACGSSLLSIDLSRSRHFTHIGLTNLVSNCQSLVEIDLSNGTDITDVGAAAISRAANLERLQLARCKNLTDLGIGCIAVGCRKLKVLSLKWCLGVTDMGVGLIAVKCKEIRSLNLSYVQITGKCLPSILQLQHLQDLVLEGCLGIGDEGLTMLNQGCKTLETLNMSNCSNLSHKGLSSLTTGAACLRQLILAHGISVTHALADSLQKLPKLQSIKLDECNVTCSGLKAIGNGCMLLNDLSLSKCTGVTDEGLSILVKKQKELRKLDITCCRKITYDSIASITASCTHLTSLRMESCSLVSKEAFVLIGQRCCLLEELDITDSEVDNEGLKSIARCSELSSLKIGICLNITDEGLIHVGSCCPKLLELDLYRSAGVTDKSIEAITRGCPKLQMINLAYCKDISDDSLRFLSKCSRLNTLEIRGCTRISSAGLSAIAVGCKQITRLDVKKCYNVNDAGILALARLSQNLRQVNLSYCSITDVGLLALASISCLQNITILHLRGLTANGLVAALLACGGLTKVKLHASFRFSLSHIFIKHMEARGCTFQWRDKPFQVEVELKDWMLD